MTAMLRNINLPMLMCRIIAVCGTMIYDWLLLPRTCNRKSGAPSYRAPSDEVYVAFVLTKGRNVQNALLYNVVAL